MINRNTETRAIKLGWEVVARVDGILFAPYGELDRKLEYYRNQPDVKAARVVVCDIDCPARWTIVVKRSE